MGNSSGAVEVQETEMMALGLDNVAWDPGMGHCLVVEHFPQDEGL